MERENENLSENHAEVSATEAALAQLRPRREARFADALKSRLRDALSGTTATREEATTMVRVPLTHYIRIAQFNAAAGGLLAGLFLGAVLGGAAVFLVMGRLQAERNQPVPLPRTAEASYLHMLLKNDVSLTPLERALLDQLDKDPYHGRRQTEFRTDREEPRGADRS